MRISSEVQARTQPIRERATPPPAEEPRERAMKVQEKAPEPPKAEGPVGKNLDTQA
jgi:hypothetical protein